MLAILLPVAASSYCYAVLVTGNPLFPFFNEVFRSPYYPLENMRDLKWMAGVTWRAPWDLVFRSEAFGQYYPGAPRRLTHAAAPARCAATGCCGHAVQPACRPAMAARQAPIRVRSAGR